MLTSQDVSMSGCCRFTRLLHPLPRSLAPEHEPSSCHAETRRHPLGFGRKATAVRALVDGLHQRGQGEAPAALRLRRSRSPLAEPPAQAGQRHRLLFRSGQQPCAGRVRRGLGPQHRSRYRQRGRAGVGPADLGRLRIPRPAAIPASSPALPRRSPASPIVSACSRSGFRSTSGRGRCAAWHR